MMPDAEAKASGGASFNTQNAGSPTSETFSHPPESQPKGSRTNGVSKEAKKPADAFELYCSETRPALEAKNKDGDAEVDVESELARGWKELPEADRDEFQAKFEQSQAKSSEPKETPAEDKKEEEEEKPEETKPAAQDEDVEMGDDTEDQDTQAGEKAGE